MPFYAGFHPYFRIAASKKLSYATDATQYLDYNDNVVKPFEGSIELDGLKESVSLCSMQLNGISASRGRLGTGDVIRSLLQRCF